MTALNTAFLYDPGLPPDVPPDVPPGVTLEEWRRRRSRYGGAARRRRLRLRPAWMRRPETDEGSRCRR